jgi:hypothetical protein
MLALAKDEACRETSYGRGETEQSPLGRASPTAVEYRRWPISGVQEAFVHVEAVDVNSIDRASNIHVEINILVMAMTL